eukprot:1159457-Pelagomonas_calceolata.AAC.2
MHDLDCFTSLPCLLALPCCSLIPSARTETLHFPRPVSDNHVSGWWCVEWVTHPFCGRAVQSGLQKLVFMR